MLAKRSVGRVKLRYRINGGKPQTASTSEWNGGEVYGGGNQTYYHVMRGFVRGTDPGDNVEVWFEGARGQRSESFTYEAVSESGRRALILSAEDYTGISPAQDPSGPHYLSYYEEALAANGIEYDVYDVDAQDRTAPDALGVLSHYDAVLWYTGDDIIPREPHQAGGTASRIAIQELLRAPRFHERGRPGRCTPASTRASPTRRATRSTTTRSRTATAPAATRRSAGRCTARATA